MNILPVILFLISFISLIGRGELASAMEWVEPVAAHMRRLATSPGAGSSELRDALQANIGQIIATSLQGTRLLGGPYNEANAFQDAAGVEVPSFQVTRLEEPGTGDARTHLILALDRIHIGEDLLISATVTLTLTLTLPADRLRAQLAVRVKVSAVTDSALCALVRVAANPVPEKKLPIQEREPAGAPAAAAACVAPQPAPVAAVAVPQPAPVAVAAHPHVTAATRFDLLMQLLRDPSFTVNTQDSRIAELYLRDRDFICSVRKDVVQGVMFLDNLVQRYGRHSNMSLNDHGKFAACWAYMLGTPSRLSLIKLKGKFDQFLAVRSTEEARALGLSSHLDFLDCTLWTFPLFHVSPKGAVPIRMISKCYGIERENGDPVSAVWCGVATDHYVTYDGIRGNCVNALEHDYAHIRSDNYALDHPETHHHPKIMVFKMTRFRKACFGGKVPPSKDATNLMEFALFLLFHESSELTGIKELGPWIQHKKGDVRERLGKLPICFAPLENRFFATWYIGAQGLKLPVEGETPQDQAASVLRLYLRGCELLEPHAHVFDEAAP